MCGIAGVIDFANSVSERILTKMVRSLNHRGPDDRGTEILNFPQCSVGLGHVRLSIIDVSSSGHQPMKFANLSLVYNGEIYNYLEVKEELLLLGHSFHTKSDTEVILHAFQEWGMTCLDRFIGMFSFVLVDGEAQKCYLVRDRAGVKPLYYYRKNEIVLFASELKAFHEHPGFYKEMDTSSLSKYLHYGFIPNPHSIFKNSIKIPPGHYIELDLLCSSERQIRYWDAGDLYKNRNNRIEYKQAKGILTDLLKSACEYRMVSDVPVGVFLSGGYDSAAVTAVLQKDRTERIKTFTIGFEEGNNETPFARQIANHLGTDHCEYTCTTKEAQSIIKDLAYYYDEPFADSSAIPTILVSKMARQSVKVALSADAGDEIFAGYNNYAKILSNARKLNRIPENAISFVKTALRLGLPLIPLGKSSLRHKIESIGFALNRENKTQLSDLFWKSNSLPVDFSQRLLRDVNHDKTEGYNIDPESFVDELSILLAIDYKTYLSDDILTKVDRATMSVSLEGREPLLDHRILEFASCLPSSFKHNGETGKLILKDIVHDFIPEQIMSRPKVGFSVPIYSWLNADLSYLIDNYLNRDLIEKMQIFDTSFVKEILVKFRSGKLYYKSIIWKILMFQMWHGKWMN